MDEEAQKIIDEIVAERELDEQANESIARSNFVRLFKSGITPDTREERAVLQQEMLEAMDRLGDTWGCGRQEVLKRLDV
jgi:hypothetical protein